MDVTRAKVEVIEAPPLGAASSGGYGSSILGRPRTKQVVFTRQLGAARVRWLTYDLGSAQFSEGKGFPGDLRGGVFDDDEAWLLGTYGLARVSFDPPRVDGDGSLVATAEWGLALVHPKTYEVTRRILAPPSRGVACWAAEARTIVYLRHYLVEPSAGGFHPAPEKLVLVRW